MMQDYFDIAFTPAVRELQEQKGSAAIYASVGNEAPTGLDADQAQYIMERDSFYMATVGETGWPYVQHRGGRAGFVTVVGPTSIGWIERSGNRQYLGTGNITADARVSLIFVDYPNRTRLKIFGRATHHATPSEELLAALGGGSMRADGAITVEVAATNWNCPKYITPRFTEEQVRSVTDPLQARIAALEAQLAASGATI